MHEAYHKRVNDSRLDVHGHPVFVGVAVFLTTLFVQYTTFGILHGLLRVFREDELIETSSSGAQVFFTMLLVFLLALNVSVVLEPIPLTYKSFDTHFTFAFCLASVVTFLAFFTVPFEIVQEGDVIDLSAFQQNFTDTSTLFFRIYWPAQLLVAYFLARCVKSTLRPLEPEIELRDNEFIGR